VRLGLSRRGLVAASGATLLAGLNARNSARAEAVDLKPPSAIAPVQPPGTLPPLAFKVITGEPVGLARFRGRPVVLNFWATWCAPCVAELPELDELAASGAVTVLAASADRRGMEVVGPFLAKHPLPHLTVLLDQESDAAHAAGVAGFPTTLIIDAEGRLRGRLEGPASWSGALQAVQKLTG
jgi:thiol-disulfide isomerase/thioredoxin